MAIKKVDPRRAFRQHPALSAWPFVVVILTQMAVGGFSVYTLSAIRAFVTGESLWSKGQHQAVYFLELYLDTADPQVLRSFRRSLAVPLAYREGREALERSPPDAATVRSAFVAGGSAAVDIPSAIWMFENFRGFPDLEAAIARWKETDPYIVELQKVGELVAEEHPIKDVAALRRRVETIENAITPRTIAFSRALDDGARTVEDILLLANFALAGVLALLTIWRVGRYLKQRRQFEDALAWQASHDDLTGLANRRAFEDHLTRVLDIAKSKGSRACALMFIDLDQFKIINDTCGHAAGDKMLRRIGPLIQKQLGADDLLARLGGDEFSIVVPDVDEARASALAEALREAVAGIGFSWNGRTFSVTASIGLVHDVSGSVSPEEMMSKADVACFMAKEKGRNRVHVHSGEDQEVRGRLREMNWVQRIQHAISEDRFCLYGQEIVPLRQGAETGIHLEVLLRMQDESGVLVPPASFLPAAERYGLMTMIDRWVVLHAFETLADRKLLDDVDPIACCGINLSGATIGDEAFLDFIKDAFKEFGIEPRSICFEVTETAAIVNLSAAQVFIDELRALGCVFALDDFGAGMSSFSYLKSLPVDFLKIDGFFVRNMLTEPADRAMVEMISHVGHVMGKHIVAEFVENDALADVLRTIGIDYVQGYGIARPKPFTSRWEAVDRVTDRETNVERRRTA